MIMCKIMAAIFCFVASATYAQRHPYVRTEEYVEMMEVIARLAGNTIFADSLAPVYQADCEEHFGNHRNHAAVEWMRNQLWRYGIGYDAVPWMGAHLRWDGSSFDVMPNCNKQYKRWPKRAVKEFLPLASDFYISSNFGSFYASHANAYASAVAAFRSAVADSIDLEWFGGFFGVAEPVDFGVIIGLNNGGGSFGIERQKHSSRREKISVMLYAETSDGTPIYQPSSEEEKILVHEFCHSYIQPAKQYRKAGKRLLDQHYKRMNSMGYGHWQNVVEETLVRASVIRYMLDHNFPIDDVRREIEIQHKFYGFVWLPTDLDWY